MRNKLTLLVSAILFVAATTLSIKAFIDGDHGNEMQFAVIALFAAALPAFGHKISNSLGAAITTLTRFSSANDNNSFAGRGIMAYTVAYAATIALVLKASFEQHVCVAQLTGATTINATLTNLRQFDRIYFHFSADGTNRVVTFGTGFVSSGTLTVTASKDATAVGIYDGTNIKIINREVAA